MALYDQLPVFKTSYELLILIYKIVKEFPKEHKNTLGEKLKTIILELVIGIYQANQATDKFVIISSLRESVEMIKLLMRVGRDIRVISIKHYADSSLLIDSIAKQLIGWQRSVK